MGDLVKSNLAEIAVNGEWTQTERMWALGGGVLVLLLLAGLVRKLILRRKRMKNAIFCNSKNKYKSRLGKKIKY